MALIRWLLFLFVGLPTQLIVYVIYPVIHLWWYFTQREIVKEKLYPYQGSMSIDIIENSDKKRMGVYHNNEDVHNMLTHWGLITNDANSSAMLTALIDIKGRVSRKITGYGSRNLDAVSGDCLVSWCFSYSLITYDKYRPKNTLSRVAWTYLKYLGCPSEKWDVSNRCNNFGINYCPDSESLKVGQPAAGPQFYTSSCLFALAARDLGLFWKFVYWTHWILLGGWYWCFSPVLYLKKRKLGYVREITMKALFVHKIVFGNKWWIKKPMVTIDTLSEAYNPLYGAMFGRGKYSIANLPEAIDPWMFQRVDCRIDEASPDSNIWIKQGLLRIIKLVENIK